MRKLSIKEMTKKRKKKGFTLIELIIVIAIIAILAAMAIPKFGAVRESANQKADVATAKNLVTAVASAIADGDTTVVTSGTTTAVAKGDSIGSKVDGDLKPKSKNAGTNTDFGYKVDATTGDISIFYGTGTVQVYPMS